MQSYLYKFTCHLTLLEYLTIHKFHSLNDIHVACVCINHIYSRYDLLIYVWLNYANVLVWNFYVRIIQHVHNEN